MSDEEEMRKFVRSLFHTEQTPDTEPLPQPVNTSAPIIDGQAATPDPLTNDEANQVLATTPNGWLGALFHDNSQIYL